MWKPSKEKNLSNCSSKAYQESKKNTLITHEDYKRIEDLETTLWKVDQNQQNIFYKENNFVYQSSNQNATDNWTTRNNEILSKLVYM